MTTSHTTIETPASHGTRPGCGVHQRAPTRIWTSRKRTSRRVTHHGAMPAVPMSRNSAQANPPMPTKPHLETFWRATCETVRAESSAAGLLVLVVPVRVVVPVLVALLGLLQRVRRLLLAAVGAEAVDRRAAVGTFDRV